MQKSDFELAPGFEWESDAGERRAAFAGMFGLCGPGSGPEDPFHAVLDSDGIELWPNGKMNRAGCFRTPAEVRAWYAARPRVTCPFVWGE